MEDYEYFHSEDNWINKNDKGLLNFDSDKFIKMYRNFKKN